MLTITRAHSWLIGSGGVPLPSTPDALIVHRTASSPVRVLMSSAADLPAEARAQNFSMVVRVVFILRCSMVIMCHEIQEVASPFCATLQCSHEQTKSAAEEDARTASGRKWRRYGHDEHSLFCRTAGEDRKQWRGTLGAWLGGSSEGKIAGQEVGRNLSNDPRGTRIESGLIGLILVRQIWRKCLICLGSATAF